MAKKRKKEEENFLAFSAENKKILLMLLVTVGLVVVLLLISFIWKGDDKETVEDKTFLESKYCNQNIVPEKVLFRVLRNELETGPRSYGAILSTWKDGTPVQTLPSVYSNKGIEVLCKKGSSSIGQNENYFYCNNLYYAKTTLDNNLNKISTEEYIIDLTLNAKNYTLLHNHPKGWTGNIDLKVENVVVDSICEKI
ncbi:hypothetical protein HYV50_03785 [Candidatus Pacearchaeota archaeon]|nr:hypothetical protein [Candidatus Pacearchaeota archaeon]